MFSFNPKTDEQIAAENNYALLQSGIYPFIVKEVTAKTSKTGNPMLELKLGILTPQGAEVFVKDFLLADSMAFKLKHFCEAIGMVNEYEQGKLDPRALVGKAGKVNLTIQKGKEKPDGSGFYNDKNAVKDYMKPTMPGQASDPAFNDKIPF